MNEPAHNNRYRTAWVLYKDELSAPESPWRDTRMKILESEMDSSQEFFGWDEFQDFKKSLDEYEEHWAGLSKDAKKAAGKWLTSWANSLNE